MRGTPCSPRRNAIQFTCLNASPNSDPSGAEDEGSVSVPIGREVLALPVRSRTVGGDGLGPAALRRGRDGAKWGRGRGRVEIGLIGVGMGVNCEGIV